MLLATSVAKDNRSINENLIMVAGLRAPKISTPTSKFSDRTQRVIDALNTGVERFHYKVFGDIDFAICK